MHWHTYFATLARYNAWATRRLLDAVAAVPEEAYGRDMGLFFRSIHGTLNHLLVGEHLLWQRRFAEGVSPRHALDEEAEPDRARLAARLLEGAARWQPLIESWPAARFEGTLRYTNTRGEDVTLPFALTLAHVFNHSTHHRGQISAALTQLGLSCPSQDLAPMLQQESQA